MWSTILGHQRQITQLKKVAQRQDLPNAYLFSGLKGIGKSLVARVFAQSLFCVESPAVCNQCISCSKIKNRQHPDVFFVEPKTERILIDQIRELQQALQFHSLEGPLKLAIINDAEAMTDSAANSLLKILEEPPSKTHFILITAFPHRILPTIRSRCQKIVFSPLGYSEVAQYLIKEVEMDEKTARQVANISQGSIGSVEALDSEFMEEVLGRFGNLVGRANTADIMATAEKWSHEDDRVHLILDLLANFYRDALYQQLTGEESFASPVEKLVSIRNSRRLANDFLAIMRARDALLTTTLNKQLLFEQLLFTLTS